MREGGKNGVDKEGGMWRGRLGGRREGRRLSCYLSKLRLNLGENMSIENYGYHLSQAAILYIYCIFCNLILIYFLFLVLILKDFLNRLLTTTKNLKL